MLRRRANGSAGAMSLKPVLDSVVKLRNSPQLVARDHVVGEHVRDQRVGGVDAQRRLDPGRVRQQRGAVGDRLDQQQGADGSRLARVSTRGP
jgi:hypothetical protein